MSCSSTPRHYRFKAEELRAIAEDFHDPAARATLARLAEDYERMAQATKSDVRLRAKSDEIALRSFSAL